MYDTKNLSVNAGVGKLRPAKSKSAAREHFFFEWNAARGRKFCGPQACKCGPLSKKYFKLNLFWFFV